MTLMLPIGNSQERYIEVLEVNAGYILRYARKTDSRWIYGKNYFLPTFIWRVLRGDNF